MRSAHPYRLRHGGLTTKFAPLVAGSCCSMPTCWAVLAVRSTHPSGVPGPQHPGGLGGRSGEQGMFAELCTS